MKNETEVRLRCLLFAEEKAVSLSKLFHGLQVLLHYSSAQQMFTPAPIQYYRSLLDRQFEHVFPVSVQSPAGFDGLRGQSSSLFNIDQADVHGRPIKTSMNCLRKETLLP